MKAVIVEDDALLAENLRLGLGARGESRLLLLGLDAMRTLST
jgi:hypothetical protein